MSRAVFLSAGGDPFISLFALKLWKERWYGEIDNFYINYNNHAGVPTSVVSEFLSKASEDPKVHIIYHPKGIGNGRPITEMALISSDDLVMLLEDDGFIFTPGKVNRHFQQIESDLTDILGSPRGSCGTEIWEASKERYSLDYSGYGDMGPNWWPNFFFCKREDLLKTDLNFGSKSFTAGEYSKELDYTFKQVNHGDTFVWACMQLRALGLRSQSIPQFHASPYEADEQETKMGNWIGEEPYWLHGGSLSTSWGGYLTGSLPDLTHDAARFEIETRVAFWTICSDVIEGFDEFKKEYKAGIARLIDLGQLNRGRINKKIEIYRNLMKI